MRTERAQRGHGPRRRAQADARGSRGRRRSGKRPGDRAGLAPLQGVQTGTPTLDGSPGSSRSLLGEARGWTLSGDWTARLGVSLPAARRPVTGGQEAPWAAGSGRPLGPILTGRLGAESPGPCQCRRRTAAQRDTSCVGPRGNRAMPRALCPGALRVIKLWLSPTNQRACLYSTHTSYLPAGAALDPHGDGDRPLLGLTPPGSVACL